MMNECPLVDFYLMSYILNANELVGNYTMVLTPDTYFKSETHSSK